MIERYETKKIKSAIVVVSSIHAIKPAAGVTTYCATKTFASFMAEGLHVETEGKVDIMSYQPGLVATKMVGMHNDAPKYGAITPEHAAASCFRDLGIYPMTRGAYSHE